MKGAITGDNLALTVTSSDPGLLPNSQYTGHVEPDGSAAGTVRFAGHDELGDVDWNMVARLFCAKDAQNAPAQQTATVRRESDVYDAPGGNGNRVGPESYFLPVGRTLTTAQPCQDNWCLLNIPDPEVPGGKGWVYAGDGFLDVK